MIYDIWLESKKRYGAPKIRESLKAKGFDVSLKRVQRQMKKLNIKSIVLKKYRPVSTKASNPKKEYPNLLNQDFGAKNQAAN